MPEFSAFWSGVVALAFNSGGFISDIVRAAPIDGGQTEAALAIGVTSRQSILFMDSGRVLADVAPTTFFTYPEQRGAREFIHVPVAAA